LARVQQGDLREAAMLVSYCTDQPEAPETPEVLEAVIEGSLRAWTAALARALVPSDQLVAAARTALDLWGRSRPGLADQVQGLVWRGRMHVLTQDHLRAVADFRAAVALDREHFEARWYLCTAVAQKAPEEALAHLRILRERYPENQQVCLVLASVCRNLGHLEEAGQMLDAFLAANPNDVSALLDRGKTALDAQQSADAERWLRRAETLAPNEAEVNLALSRCLRLAGRAQEAQRYLDRFHEIEARGKQAGNSS